MMTREQRLRQRQGVANSNTQQASSEPEVVDVPAPRTGPLDINTLKYALIDPDSRAVTFIGRYDSDYATGPIPYADLLNDALGGPYPSFSIEPTEQQQSQFRVVDRMISADISKMTDSSYCNEWAQKLMDLLLNDPSLQADNKRLFMNFGAAVGLTGNELKRLFDGAKGRVELSPAEFFETTSKLMRGIGAPRAADGLMALSSGGSIEDKLRNMANGLGLSSQFQELESKGLSADQFKTEAIILCISEMCRQFEAPESGIENVVSSIRSGGDANAIVGYMGDQMSSFITNKAGSRMLNGLVMGPDTLSRMYNIPVPKSDMSFKNVAADSVLGDVLFKADYRLKSVCTFPDAREKVADHLTDLEFSQKEAVAANYSLPAGSGAMVGHRLVPDDVKMRVSPNGNVIEFGDSQIKVVGWTIQTLCSGAAADFINGVTPKYASYLTQRYDDYARAYPEWHKMREAAKVIALVRWAKKNNYTINVHNPSGAKIPHPAQVNGFWSAAFEVEGEKASLTLVAHGGASFSQEEGEDWIKPEPDVTVTSSVLKQLVASTVLAEQAANAAVSGSMESARDLADKSARAMTGEIDLTQLPSLDGIPVPGEPASYAAATAEVINEASDCLQKMDAAQKDMARADQIAATSPDEAAKIKEQAAKTQDEAQARLKEILGSVSAYKTDPSKAGGVVVALQGNSGVVTPIGGNASSSSTSGTSTAQNTTPSTSASQPEDWSARQARLTTELEKVNKEVASTRGVLLKLNASVQADRKQFNEWESAADAAFDRCVGIAADVAVDFSAGALADRYGIIHDIYKDDPNAPELIEKYRLLASLAQRMKEAKAANDLNGLAEREGKTDTEIYEQIRDGIGQLSGLLGLDKTVPGMFWKYGSMGADMAYNLTELWHGWKNVGTLEGNNARYAEAVKKLAERMQKLIERQKELKRQIEAGEQPQFGS